MSDLRIAIRSTFLVDMDEVLSRINAKAPLNKLRAEVRFEVQHLVSEMCDRLLDCPALNEEYLAWHLCKEDLADPKPGYEPPGWDGFKRDRESADEQPN